MKIRRISFVFALACFCAASAFADTYTWTGKAPAGHSQDWSNVQNWSPSNNVPGIGDTAIIVPVNSSGFVVNLDQDVQVGSLTLVSGIIQGSHTLKTFGTFECQDSILAPAGLTISGGLTVDPVDNNHKTMEVDCPTTISGSATINSNTIFKVGTAVTVVNAGNFTLAGGGQLNLGPGPGATFVNNSLFYAGNAICSSGSSIFSNAPSGTVIVDSGATMQVQGILADNGTLQVNSGGTASITAATTLLDGASFIGSGTTILLSGNNTLDGTVTVQGNLQLGGDTSTPVLTLNGYLEILANAHFHWFGDTLSGRRTDVTGTVHVNANGNNTGTMLMNGNTLALKNCIVENDGFLNWSNNATVFMGYNARIANYYQFDFYDDGTLSPLTSGSAGYGSAELFNYGTLEKRSGAFNSATSISVPITDYHNVFNGSPEGNIHFNGGGEIGEYWGLLGQGNIELSGGDFIAKQSIFNGPDVSASFVMNGSATLNIPSNVTLKVQAIFQQSSGTIFGNGVMNVANFGQFNWSGGTIAITNPAAVAIDQYGNMNISGAAIHKIIKGGGIKNHGTINWTNDNTLGGVDAWDNVVFDNAGRFNIQCDSYLNDASLTVRPVFTNETTGVVSKTGNAGTTSIGFNLVNTGKIMAQMGTLEFLSYSDFIGIPGNQETVIMNGGGLKFDIAAVIHAQVSGSGQLNGAHGLTFSDAEMDAFSISFAGDVTNDEPVVVGDAPGKITFNNTYTQTANGKMVIPIRGTNAATMDFGQVIAAGLNQVNLAGTLEVNITEGYAPPVGATFPFLNSFQRNGTFSNVILPPGLKLNYTSGGATLVVTGTVPVTVLSPTVVNGQFQFGFNTITNRSYTVQYKDDLASGTWTFLTNFTGDGSYWQTPPLSPLVAQRYFRASNP
jgi:hypothetical protein